MNSNVDNVLRQWDERYNAKEGDKPKNLNRDNFRPLKGGKGSAAAARAALAGIARKSPQAIVKITPGANKGSKGIGAHLRYISRHGQLALEDQDGVRHEGKHGRLDILERWENSAYPLPEESKYREAFNFVLSSEKGTDPAALHQAVRDFAQEQFGGQHDYAMALHCPQTDPSAKKSENPHVHLVVRARSKEGVRLNPRKADLFAYRQAYARHLRANGIDAIAVRRDALFNTKKKGQKQATYQMKKRGAERDLAKTERTQPGALQKALANEARTREIYGDVVAALAKSELAGDRKLGEQLRQALPQLQPVPVKTVPAQGRKR